MKLLLIHLSDIHLKGPDDLVFSRVQKISDAVRNLEYELATCFVVVSGDTAFSGSEDQYYVAVDFVEELREALATKLRLPGKVKFVVVPGNHDCDFSGSVEVRNLLLEGIERDAAIASDKQIIKGLTTVQDNYFEYQSLLAEGSDHLRLFDRLHFEYRFDLDQSVVFRCYNTAWVSQLHERAGQLIFPIDAVDENEEGADLVVAVFHHPYNWLQPENGRAFRKHVERTSDLILTGHEHDQLRQTRASPGGQRNEYIEGGVLQETDDPSVSNFNALVLDLVSKRQKYFCFTWQNDLYAPTSESSDDWEEFQGNKLRSRREFEVNDEFRRYLEDPGAPIAHPSRDALILSDVFVYPDLREEQFSEDAPKVIRSDEVLDFVLQQQRVMLTGPDTSGKTSLAKTLYADFSSRGLVPILLNGATLGVRADDTIYKSIDQHFRRQYSPELLEKFRQLDRSEKVIVLDDFDGIRSKNPRAIETLVTKLYNVADYVVFLANGQAQHMNELTSGTVSTSLNDVPRYSIEEFGGLLKEELIANWFALEEDYYGLDEIELAHKYNTVHELLNTITQRNFVPAYPVFLLSILQALEHNTQIDTNANQYGYFYELLIRTSLAKASDLIGANQKHAYLAFLAYRLFENDNLEPSMDELRAVHEEYTQEYMLRLPFEGLLQSLAEAKILERANDGYRFKYDYSYFYFVATYLKDSMSNDKVRAQVSEMTSQAHMGQHASILLFLAYLVKDVTVIEEMIAAARDLYKDQEPANLVDDVQFLNDSIGLSNIPYVEKDPTTGRKEVLAVADQVGDIFKSSKGNNELEPKPSVEGNQDTPDFRAAQRTIQILGEMAKNSIGSLRGDLVLAVTAECYWLALRTLRAFLRDLREREDQFYESYVNDMKETDPDIEEDTLREQAKNAYVTFTQMISLLIIRQVSREVGFPLLREIHAEIWRENPTVPVGLVNLRIKLDSYPDFPENDIKKAFSLVQDNPFALAVLRFLVVTHFMMVRVPNDQIQRTCHLLGIRYEKNVRVPNLSLRRLRR